MPKVRAPSLSREPQADEAMMVEVLERHDGFATLRNKLRDIAGDRGHWAGIPMPLEDEELVIEPSYPNAEKLMSIGRRENMERDDSERIQMRNTFWSCHLRSDVVVYETASGKIRHGIVPGANHLTHDLKTLGCAEAWGIEQERKALDLLGTLLSHRQFKQYLLTGSFLESSKRSGITYMFRKLKPTVALHNVDNEVRILCALCLHPIAYYQGSWAGAMTPTDDIVAHLMLMRGDETMLWRRANQHAAHRPEAGI